MDLGKVGVWWSGSWQVVGDPSLNVPAELEALGFRAIWSSGGVDAGLSSRFQRLLASTNRMVVASGIVNIWKGLPEEVAPAVAALESAYRGRFLLGLGASHAPVIEDYARPYSHMVEYLDALDAMGPIVPKDRRILAALGPKMLTLAADRAAGAHPYLVPVEHTARARTLLGDGPLLAPELAVVVEANPAKARTLARSYMALYLTLPNYVNNLRSLGYHDSDLANGGSDRLVDAIVAWGSSEDIGRRVREHHEAGADHVCVQIVAPTEGFPIAEYRELAAALLL